MLRSFAGGSSFGEVWGSGPARVLALHGWARSHQDFSAAFGSGLGPQGRAVVAPDLAGFGATPAPPEPWGSDEYALAVARLFESEGAVMTGPAVVVGHSFGGRVAVSLAAARPDLVCALVLTGVPLLPRPGGGAHVSPGYRLIRAARRAHLVGERRLERARQRYGSADYRAAQGVMRDVLVRVVSERYEDKLRRLKCPIELVWSDNDTEAPWSVAEEVAAMVPTANLTTCGEAGHLTPLSAPEAVAEAAQRALAAAHL